MPSASTLQSCPPAATEQACRKEPMRRFLLTALLLVVAGTALTTTALPAHSAEEPEPSTSCNWVGTGPACVTTPTPICVSDQGSCPFPVPSCWYEGEEPFGIKQLSCHYPDPYPDDPDRRQGICVDTPPPSGRQCVYGNYENGGHWLDSWCPWLNFLVFDRVAEETAIGRRCR